jgi:lipopolysaccharide export system protein LptC
MAEQLLKLFPVVLLTLLAALTYWLDQAVQSLPAQSADKMLLHNPDFTVETLLATRMDVNGRIRDTLHAAKMVHYPDDDSTALERPRYVSLAHGTPLTVTSKTALVTSNAGNIYFRGDVVANRATPADRNALTVNTEYLHVIPDDNLAKTDQHVTISDATMRIEAAGMELNSETRELKLHGGVRGVYYDANTVEQGKRTGTDRK